jgi:hypothetical protein
MQAPETKYEGSIALPPSERVAAVAAEVALLVSGFNLPRVDPLANSPAMTIIGTMRRKSHLDRRLSGGAARSGGFFRVRSTDTA